MRQMSKVLTMQRFRFLKAIHAKIKNRRLNTIHQFTHKVVKENGLIIIGCQVSLRSPQFHSVIFRKSKEPPLSR